jgi:hypothetical protein
LSHLARPYAAAIRGDVTQINWDGTSLTVASAGTPRQRVGRTHLRLSRSASSIFRGPKALGETTDAGRLVRSGASPR